jgi:hypothetical protein
MEKSRTTGRKTLVCPQCGQAVDRERRKVVHRLLSILLPVRYYRCRDYCGWTGLIQSPSRFGTYRLLSIALLIVLAVFWMVGVGGIVD